MSVRDSIIDELRLLASPSKQLDYERSLTGRRAGLKSLTATGIGAL
jgi:hypothetical protein